MISKKKALIENEKKDKVTLINLSSARDNMVLGSLDSSLNVSTVEGLQSTQSGETISAQYRISGSPCHTC